MERFQGGTKQRIERGDILLIHTGYHRYYPENWTDRSKVDETKYFIRHPGPTRAAVLEVGRELGADLGCADADHHVEPGGAQLLDALP